MYKLKKKKNIFTNLHRQKRQQHIISLLVLFIFLISGINGLEILDTIKNKLSFATTTINYLSSSSKNNQILIQNNRKQEQQKHEDNYINIDKNNEINILEIINRESVEDYLIYWKRGYIEKKYEPQLKLHQYVFYKLKIVFWMELTIRPLVYIYLWFPNFYGFGFYSGQEYQEICSSISSISSIMWNNHLYKPLCYEIISKKFNVFLYTSLILAYFIITIVAVKNVFYLIIKKSC